MTEWKIWCWFKALRKKQHLTFAFRRKEDSDKKEKVSICWQMGMAQPQVHTHSHANARQFVFVFYLYLYLYLNVSLYLWRSYGVKILLSSRTEKLRFNPPDLSIIRAKFSSFFHALVNSMWNLPVSDFLMTEAA